MQDRFDSQRPCTLQGSAVNRKAEAMKRFRRPSPGVVLGVIAVVLALAGTAVAASNLKLANFEPSSRDRLAGTGVIQYASQTHDTGAASSDVKIFSVQCAAAKKATAGGFKWLVRHLSRRISSSSTHTRPGEDSRCGCE